MWTENAVFREDLERLAQTKYIPWDILSGKRVFVTGATGLIGYTLVSALLYYSKTRSAGIRVTALVRNVQKAAKKFASQIEENCGLEFVEGCVEKLPRITGEIDYIIHGASPTASAYFVEKPVETIQTAVMGTGNMLELARERRIAGFVYLSSMEVYGAPESNELIAENFPTYVDSMSVRSSYPQAKLLCETLCASYFAEHGIPVTVARLSQTFGPGIDRVDKRVFAYAARCALNGEDVCLSTSGAKENMYLYTADAVGAILLLAVNGKPGNAYNVGNPSTYCSIKEMAELAARELGNGNISVLTNCNRTASGFYPPEGRLKLDISKLMKLGWHANVDLHDMFHRMVLGFELRDLETRVV